MKTTTPLTLSLATALAVTVLLTSAKADTVTFTTTTPVPLTFTDWNTTLLFQQFNTSLGTLESVTLDFSSGLQTTLTVTNTASSSSSGTAKTELQVTINDATTGLNVPELDLLSPAFSYNLNAGDQVISGQLTKSGTSDNTYSAALLLAEFTGTGTIGLPASTFTQTDLSNTGGNTSASQQTQADLTGSVTYTFAPVPEPSSALMALTGLGMVAGFRRPGRKSQR